jgi:hypothetical protein
MVGGETLGFRDNADRSGRRLSGFGSTALPCGRLPWNSERGAGRQYTTDGDFMERVREVGSDFIRLADLPRQPPNAEIDGVEMSW